MCVRGGREKTEGDETCAFLHSTAKLGYSEAKAGATTAQIKHKTSSVDIAVACTEKRKEDR